MKKVIVLIVFMIGFNNLTNAQWQNCGFSHTLNQVSIRDSAIYVLDGTVGDIYASLNNGNTWNLLSGLTNHGITSFALQGTNIFACSGNRGIYLSTDNGVTWIQKNNGLLDTNITSLAVLGNYIFAGTYTQGIFISSDSGSNWMAVNNGLTNLLVKTLTVSGTKIYAGTSWFNGGVFVSSNNGSNWTLINNGLQQEDVKKIAVKDTNILVAYPTHGIYYTSNNGVNWISLNNKLPDSTILELKYCESYLFVNSQFDNVFLSINNGISWIPFNDGWTFDTNILDFAINNTYLFAAEGDPNGLWRRRITDIPSSLNGIYSEDHFSIYPNPTNDKLNIDLSFITDTKAKIVLCDLLGNSIKTIDEGIFSKKHIVTDTYILSEGVYLIKVELPNKTIIKKLAIIR